MAMKRTNYHFSKQAHDKLKSHSKESGLGMAEIVRRAVDEYLKSNMAKAS